MYQKIIKKNRRETINDAGFFSIWANQFGRHRKSEADDLCAIPDNNLKQKCVSNVLTIAKWWKQHFCCRLRGQLKGAIPYTLLDQLRCFQQLKQAVIRLLCSSNSSKSAAAWSNREQNLMVGQTHRCCKWHCTTQKLILFSSWTHVLFPLLILVKET